MRKPLLIILLFPVLSAIVGCSSVKAPSLSLSGPTIIDTTPDGQVLLFELAATNPNDQELPLIEVNYRATSEGRTLFRTTRSAQASAPREGVSTIRLPVPIAAEIPLGSEVRIAGKLVYRKSGRLSRTLAEFGIRRSKSFSHTGSLDDPER